MIKVHDFLDRRNDRAAYSLLGCCATAGLLLLLKGTPVHAAPPGVDLTALYNQVQTLQNSVTGQAATIGALQSKVNSEASQITNLENAYNSFASTIAGMTNKTKYLSTGTDENGYPATFLTGCNVWVQDGTGTNNDNGSLTGLGNLIIGYNGAGHRNGDVRTGSHNLILGDESNYSSYCGIVAGFGNAVTGTYSSVLAGSENLASADYTSVSGGYQNSATFREASVSGGIQNMASGLSASVSGGYGNIAGADYSSVTGGGSNYATGGYSSISGGYSNWVTGSYSTISGGSNIYDTTQTAYSWYAGSLGGTYISGNFTSP